MTSDIPEAVKEIRMIKKQGVETHVGQVVAAKVWERNVSSDHAMIDSGAMLTVVVVDGDSFKTLTFDNGWGDLYVTATVDAPAEVVSAYAERVKAEAKARYEAELQREREREARIVMKGREVIVVKGRKVPHGTQGRVFWVGFGQYGERCGFTTASGETHWTATTNVKVVTK